MVVSYGLRNKVDKRTVVLEIEQNAQGVIDHAVRFAITQTNQYTESVPRKWTTTTSVAIGLFLAVSKDYEPRFQGRFSMDDTFPC